MVPKFHVMSEKFITDRIFIYVIHFTTTTILLLLLLLLLLATITGLLLLLLHHSLQSGAFTKCYHKVMGIRIWEKNMFGVAKGNSRRNIHTLQHSCCTLDQLLVSILLCEQNNWICLLSSFSLLTLWHSSWNKINFWCWVQWTHTLHCTLGHNQRYNMIWPWQSKV